VLLPVVTDWAARGKDRNTATKTVVQNFLHMGGELQRILHKGACDFLMPLRNESSEGSTQVRINTVRQCTRLSPWMQWPNQYVGP